MIRSMIACITVCLLAGCAGVDIRVHYPGDSYDPYPVSLPGRSGGYRQAGIASYYADKYQGRLTANGERFDQQAMTAAHKSLPFGSVVRVVNVANGRNVVVRINDRGPFVSGRIIDLSWSAFRRIEDPREELA